MKGGTSDIIIIDNKVIKTIKTYLEYSIFEREIYIYKLLNSYNFDWCSKLISYDSNNKTITLEYKGIPISKHNIPHDWEKQLEIILYDMKSLNMKHNDLKPSNILVNNGRLYLIDFQWCTINNTLNLNGKMCGEKLLCFNFPHDDTILERLRYIYNERRNPYLQHTSSNVIIKDSIMYITGYHKYHIINNNIYHTNKKLAFVSEYVKKLNLITIADLGCNNGLLCCLLSDYDIIGYEHEDDCFRLHKSINNFIELNTIKWKFGDSFRKSDIVIMLALIHWIFSCTSLYGKFNPIIEYLHSHTNKYLIIEWVDTNDNQIQKFKHTSFNKDIIQEEYNHDNFAKSLSEYFTYKKIYDVNETRKIYLCEKIQIL